MAEFILFLDTSGPVTSAALYDQEGKSLSVISEKSESHSTRLEVIVRNLLLKCSVNSDYLSSIVVGSGPGSFTGLRISFAFAKGLALGLGIGIYSVSSLQAVADQFAEKYHNILAIDDARRDQYFVYCADTKITANQSIVDSVWIEDWKKQNSSSVVCSPVKLQIETEVVDKPLAVCLAESFFSRNKSYPEYKDSMQIADLTPNYMRQVSALSIKQRQEKGLL